MPNFDANLRNHVTSMLITIFRSMSPGMKALFFVLLVLMFAGIGSAVGMGLSSMLCGGEPFDLSALAENGFDSGSICQLRVLNVSNQVIMFLGAALFFGVLFGWQAVDRFRWHRPASTFWLVPLLAAFALPLIQASYEVNRAIIPENSALAKLIRPAEELAEQMTSALLDMPDLNALLINLFVVAVVPAICEEFAFRGVLQVQLAKLFKNIHAAVWVSAAVFSFIHFQFYGFLPRLLLGAFFGYLLVHTGSIWAPMLAHFLNNAAAVTVHYLSLHHPTVDVEQIETPESYPLVLLLAAVAFTLLLWVVLQKSVWKEYRHQYLAQQHDKNPTHMA